MSKSHSKSGPAADKPSLTGNGAAYIRVSTDQQDTDRQHAAVKNFESMMGVLIPPSNWFKDEGYSRDEADIRPDFQRMLKLAEGGAIRWIVADRLDRFGTKNEKQLIAYLYRLEEAGCKLYDASGRCWSDEDIATVITAVIEGAKSKGEQIEKSHRSLGGKAAKSKLGEWMGGGARFGIDVGCFSRDSGKELWRVIFQGKDRRLKVYFDGDEERFDGKRNFPPTAVTERLQIVPTKDKAKLEAVKTLFKRYADESISFTALANWLNELGHRNGNGGKFQGVHVQQLLEDTAYIGIYAFGKWKKGKFNHLEQGQIVHELNYSLKSTKRSPEDWQKSEQLFAPIINQATWDKVQQKLQQPKREYAPRSSKMIFGGILYCGNCGQRMRGKSASSEYFCGSWHRAIQGLLEAKECHCGRHPVKQAVVDRYVEEWLDRASAKLETLVDSLDSDDAVAPREAEYRAKWKELTASLDTIAVYLKEHHPNDYSDIIEAEGNLPASLIAAYRSLFSPAKLKNRLAALTAQHDQLTAKYIHMPDSATPRMREALFDQAAAVERQMDALEAQLDNTADRAEQHLKDLQGIQTAIKEAKAAVKKGGERSQRARAQALRGVISRIECHFEAVERKSSGFRYGSIAGSQLVRVVIFPVDGQPQEIPVNPLMLHHLPATTVK